jgi:hypothetical protein
MAYAPSAASIYRQRPPQLWLVMHALLPVEVVLDADVAEHVVGQRAGTATSG